MHRQATEPHLKDGGIYRKRWWGWLDTSGISISVTRKVDQSTLPPEDRIPDCLEGIPVQVVKEEPPELIMNDFENEEENNGIN